MTLIQLTSSPNPTLRNHKLLLLIYPLPPTYIPSLHSLYPDLEIVHLPSPWFTSDLSAVSSDDWKDTTILLTGNGVPDKEDVPRMEVVQLPSAGADWVVGSGLFRETKVAFCTANGVHGPQISEWVIAQYLSFQHHFPRLMEYQKEAKWQRTTKVSTVHDAVSQRIGILGYGFIGRQIARLSQALGMSIHAYTLHPRTTSSSRRDKSYRPPHILGDPDGLLPAKWFSGGSKEELHEFLGSGLDLLVVCLPLTEKTRHLISEAEFRVLGGQNAKERENSEKKSAFVVNIARGPVIDTKALIGALEGDVIRGAAVDVTDPEPLPDGHPLWTTKNVMVSPHISGASEASTERVLDLLKVNLGRLSEGKELVNQVSRRDGY